MRKVSVLLAMIFGILGTVLLTSSFKVHAANVSVTAPSASGRYSNIPIAFTQSAPILGNIIRYTFTPVSGGSALSVDIEATSNPYSSALNPHALLSHPDVVAAPGLGIPDNLYNITVSWQRASDSVAENTSINNVVVDTVTSPGIIDEPQTGGSYTDSLPISVYLPDPASPGSVRVVFYNNGTGASTTLNLIDTPPGSVFYTNPRNIVVASPITATSASSLEAGNYNMTLTYTDDLGNPASSVIENNFTIVAATVTPPVTPPASPTNPPPSSSGGSNSNPGLLPTDPDEVITTIDTSSGIVSYPVMNADGTPISNSGNGTESAKPTATLLGLAILCCISLVILGLLGTYLAFKNPKVKAWFAKLKSN